MLGLYPGLHTHCLILKGTACCDLLQMSSENVLEMVRLYSHCSCRYLTLLLVKWVDMHMQICIFPRVSRRCIMTAAGPQEHGGVSHLRRDHVRARGRPDGSTALQHARRTNVQVRTINVLLLYVYKMYVQNKITSIQWLYNNFVKLWLLCLPCLPECTLATIFSWALGVVS